MKHVADMLYEICEDRAVFDPDVDLVESGLLDSYALIELLTQLEDEGIVLPPTRIDRSLLHSVKGIETLIAQFSR